VIRLRRMRRTEHITNTGDMKNAYKVMVGKPEGQRPLGRLSVNEG